jgi:hypothetical protein
MTAGVPGIVIASTFTTFPGITGKIDSIIEKAKSKAIFFFKFLYPVSQDSPQTRTNLALFALFHRILYTQER